MGLITSDKKRIVIGLGVTGMSVVRCFLREGLPFAVADTRDQPPGLEQLKADHPELEIRTGALDADWLSQAAELVVSPGIAIAEPAIRAAAEAGVAIRGDIDLFCERITAPVIAITGSNAKSTVTTLVGDMARVAGIDVGVGGNLGTPVLDMLADGEQALYVLELSSFQLETTHLLRAEVATVLNISPDHLDRYDSMQDYYRAKHRIFRGCRKAVVNRDDSLTFPLLPGGVGQLAYHAGRPDLKLYGICREQDTEYLAVGLERLMPVSELRGRGQHNVVNALSALALGSAAGIPQDAMLQALREFRGLPHRCEFVADKKGVSWVNDSKGTNVGATVAALNGLGPTLAPGAGIVLIAGGVGKGAEFSELNAPMQQYGRAQVLIGEDAQKIAEAVAVETRFAQSMEDAVAQAAELAMPGDIVLLSPACASFDMFKNFNVRGEAFVQVVEAL